MTLRFLRSLAKVLFCGAIGAVMLSLLPWKLALIAFLFGCLFVFWRGAQTMAILLIASSAYGQFGGVQQPMFSMLSVASPGVPSGFLRLWLKPESIESLTNGARIMPWLDSSPYLNHGTNPVAASPIKDTNTFQGYPIARFFGGASTFLQFRTNWGMSMLRNAPGSTLYMVLTPYSTASGMYPFYVKDNTGSKLRLGPNGNLYRIRFIGKSIDADADQLGNYGNTPSDPTKFYLLNMIVNYPGQSWMFYTNGVQSVAQSGMGWTSANTSDTDSATADPNMLGLDYIGKMVEVILYSTNHADADRALVETYLTNKYGHFSTW